jgi:hypothetical protein
VIEIDALYRPVGMVVVWLLIALLALAVLGLVYLAVGFIYGAQRFRRYGHFRPDAPAWAPIIVGLCWLKDEFVGWGGGYVWQGGKKLYRFGFARMREDEPMEELSDDPVRTMLRDI